MAKIVFLDLDGTLTDPYTGISRCILDSLDRLGAPQPDATELRQWIGPPLLSSFEAWFRQHSFVADPGQALLYYRERFARTGLFENELYEGVPGLLETLAKSLEGVFLATSKPRMYADRILEYFRLKHLFTSTYGSELDGRYTDKAELLQLLLVQEALDTEDCIMVGDRCHDIDAAHAHGIRACGVLWGYGDRDELEHAGADHLVSSVGQLQSLLISLAR